MTLTEIHAVWLAIDGFKPTAMDILAAMWLCNITLHTDGSRIWAGTNATLTPEFSKLIDANHDELVNLLKPPTKAAEPRPEPRPEPAPVASAPVVPAEDDGEKTSAADERKAQNADRTGPQTQVLPGPQDGSGTPA